MNQINRKLNFFRNCHQADGQAQTLWDAFSSKVSLRNGVSVDAWNNTGLLQIDAEYQDLLAKTLDRYSRESSLILCHSFITCFHQVTNFGHKSKGKIISCPVYYYPAEYSDEGIRIDHTRGVINPAAKSLLSGYPIEIQTQIDSLYLSSKNKFRQLSQIGSFESLDHNALLNGLASLSFDSGSLDIGQLTYIGSGVDQVRSIRRKFVKGQAAITGDLMLCVIPKSKNAQGVSHELEELTKHTKYSLPLRTILLEKSNHESLD